MKLKCFDRTGKPTNRRFLRVTSDGLLRIDRADGNYTPVELAVRVALDSE